MTYVNGDYKIEIQDDGTLIRTVDSNIKNPKVDYPCSIDVKITNHCDQADICTYCHERSNKSGKHGDLDLGLKLFASLPSGTEIAIGGGNPLDHPNLVNFLWHLKNKKLISNLTINSRHLTAYSRFINKLLDEKLIKGLGVSWTANTNDDPRYCIYNRKNIVYHLIIGVDTPYDYELLVNASKSRVGKPEQIKVLLLGFKNFGNGAKYLNRLGKKVQNNIDLWKSRLPNYLLREDGNVISFDNLAILQLEIQELLKPEVYNKFYMGDDGKFSMYVDLVNKQYAKTSTSGERFDIGELEFINIKNWKRSISMNNFNNFDLPKNDKNEPRMHEIFQNIRSL